MQPGYCRCCLLLQLLQLGWGAQSAGGRRFNVALQHQRYLISDSAEVQGYQELDKRDVVPFAASESNLKGSPGQGYCVRIGIGTPPQFFNILVDTGSSNFAVAGKPHRDIRKYFHASQSSSLEWLNELVFVPYTQGRWNGHLATDTVRLGFYPNRTVRSYISVIDSSSQFFISTADWQGILGMAYNHIASPHPRISTFFDSLVSQWGIGDVFSLQLCGTTRNKTGSVKNMDGSLTLGGVDPKLFNGQMYYVPIRKEWYYEVVIVDIRLDGKSLAMDCKEYNFDKSIVDSGTTDIRLPRRVFDELVLRLKLIVPGVGNRFYYGDTLLCLPEGTGPWHRFPVLTVSLLYTDRQQLDLNLSPQQYLRYVGEVFDVPGKDCFKFGLQSSDKGAVLGAVFMEGYYVVFDRENRRMGFAQSTCNAFTRSVSVSNVSGPAPYSATEFSPSAWDCAFFQPSRTDEVLLVAAIALAALCCLCAVPVCCVLCVRQCRRCRRADSGEKSPLVK